MNDFCTLTCDRGDRPQFFEHCKYQLSRMTIKPGKSYFIDHAPKSRDFDLVERLKMGIALAKQDGFDKCYIMESDDFYPADYFERMAFLDYDIVGDDHTTYYHLKNQGIQFEKHPLRSSLFTTGFRISKLEGMVWPADNNVWVDIAIWRHAQRRKLKRRFTGSGAVGIKHSTGLTAGVGHKQSIYKRFDKNYEWLALNVDDKSLDLYKNYYARELERIANQS